VIDQIVREGARRMLADALRAEVDAYVAAFADQRDERRHRLVVRNGYHQPREVVINAGAVEVTRPGSTTAPSARTPGRALPVRCGLCGPVG
jgi:hypothetical protein